MNTLLVLSVAIAAAGAAMIACVISVFACSRTLRAAAKLHSMTSMRGELIEIRDYVSKLDAWAKRINSREVMRERREEERSNGATPTRSSRRASGAEISKDELRRIAGIVPGRPAPHKE
jgi:hypothetical protein